MVVTSPPSTTAGRPLAVSQEQVAHAAGISVATYGKIERSLDPVASVNPRLDTITRLAAAMDIEPADFCSLLCGDTGETRREANPAADDGGWTHDECSSGFGC